MSGRKSVRVACVSTDNSDQSVKRNLDSTIPFIESSVKDGAKLVLLPELMSTQYKIDTSIWDLGETLNDGYTLKFLSKQSKKYSIYLGTSFFECSGLDFYNTFILTDPNGNLIGKIRKVTPAGPESFLYSGYDNKHIINTKYFGNILAGICYENHTSAFENELIEYKNNNKLISMILQPHSCPYMQPVFGASKTVTDAFNRNADNVSIQFAQKYNIPVLFANKVGKYPNPFMDTCMGGWSKIVDYNGNIVIKSNNFGSNTKPVHDYIVGDININTSNNKDNIKKYEYVKGHWGSCVDVEVFKGDKSFTIPYFLQENAGYIFYKLSIQRRRKASKISGFSWIPSYITHVSWLCWVSFMMYRKYNN